jgi:hypothetical protein
MRQLICALLLGLAAALLAPAAYGQTSAPTLSIEADAPRFPTPMQVSVLGLSLTAIAVVGARASHRSSDTMMYTVLATVALTAILVAYSNKLHSEFVRAGFEKLEQLQQQATVAKNG